MIRSCPNYGECVTAYKAADDSKLPGFKVLRHVDILCRDCPEKPPEPLPDTDEEYDELMKRVQCARGGCE